MKGPSAVPRIICHVLLLALAGSTAFAGEPQVRREEDRSLAPRIETSPQLDKAREQKTSVDMPMAPDAMRKLWVQCEQSARELQDQFDALQLQHTSLQQQLKDLQQKLNDATHPGGSAVTAYCESPSVSRNTAGATTDCGIYKCEEVSGLCRTQCTLTSECNGICDSTNEKCIP